MGRGDKKTAKGKRFKGSFGKSRPAVSTAVKKKAAVKKSKENNIVSKLMREMTTNSSAC